MRKKKRRKLRFTIYCIWLSISMLLTLLSVPSRAAEPIETGAGYEQEQEQQQTHEYTETCDTLTKTAFMSTHQNAIRRPPEPVRCPEMMQWNPKKPSRQHVLMYAAKKAPA